MDLTKVLLAAAGYGVALWVGMTFELSLTLQMSLMDFFIVVSFLVILQALFSCGWVQEQSLPSHSTRQKIYENWDLWQVSGAMVPWNESHVPSLFLLIPIQSPQKATGELPNLVVVQSESFFDVRQVFAGIRPEILTAFDSLQTSASSWGKLAVPAWGANTVRTEFAFLSGVSAAQLSIHRFNPYRKLARQNVPTLVSFLRNLGYRTVCVHPYPASFYNRDKVFPLLGFDEFIDIYSFTRIEKTGPYVGDVALAEKVCALLRDSSAQPIFVFVITMENHGPLHLEKVQGRCC